MKAHRVAYMLTVGPIPDGMTLDHLCHTTDRSCLGGVTCLHRRCVEPKHLEVVTRVENSRRMKNRREKCANGHYYDEAGYERWFKGGTQRVCSTCCPLVYPGLDKSKECVNGHAMTPENVYIDSRGCRLCHTCRRESHSKYEAKSKAKIAAYHSQRQQAAKAERHEAVRRMVQNAVPIEDIAAFLGTSVKGAKRTVTLASRDPSTLSP